MRCFLPLLLTLSLSWPTAAAAQVADAPSDLAANAAIQYWQAFALMPTLDKEQEKLLDDWYKAPLDAAALKLIASSHNSLTYLHRGAKLPRCDWGLDYNEGISLQLPHLAKARNLARLAALHARHELEQGRGKAARQDATSIIVLARHVGRDPFLICTLMRIAIEGMAIELVAPYAPEMKGAYAHAVAMYEAMPAAASITQGILNEKKYMMPSIIRQLREADQRKPGGWRVVWKQMLGSPEAPAALTQVDSLAQIVKLMEDFAPYYDEMATLVALPPAEFDAQFPAFQKRATAANPLGALLLPELDRLLAQQRRHEVRMAMLLAALAVAEGGPDRLKDIKDPFGAGPFEYRALEKGFELKSKLVFEGEPVALTAGKKIKP